MQNLFFIRALEIWLTVFLSFILFDFAVHIKILFIALKTQSKEIISSFMSFWNFLYNFFLLILLAFFSVVMMIMFYSTEPIFLRYFLFLIPASFIIGLFVKIKWIEKLTVPKINFFGISIPISRAGGLHGYIIRWRVKNVIIIYYNILKIVSAWLLIIGLIFFIFFLSTHLI